MNSIIISGATSMLGIAAIKYCIANNIRVGAITREHSSKLDILPKSDLIKIIKCNLENISQLDFNTSYDAFLHLGWDGASKDNRFDPEYQLKNINYTLDCVKIAKKLNCKSFVGAGSQAEYGRYEGRISPDMSTRPDNAYGIAKLAAGGFSRILCETLEIRHSWVRIFSTYGMYDMDNTLISYLFNNMKKNEDCDLTLCRQEWDYLYSDDCGRALALVAEKGKNNAIYNIGSGKAYPLKYYVETIKSVLNSNSKLNYGAIPYSDKQVMHLCADISNLTRDTGFIPEISFEQGIRNLAGTINDEK